MRAALLLALLASTAAAGPAVDKLKVPAEHPRIAFGPGDLEKLRERVKAAPWSDAWKEIESRGDASKYDPKNMLGGVAVLQSRCFLLTECVECAAFRAAIRGGEDAALSKFFEEFDPAPFEKGFTETEFMPRGEFLEGLAVAYDWAYPNLTDAARKKLRALVERFADFNYKGFLAKKSWEATCEANNHSVSSTGGVGLAGLALWGENPDAPKWVALAADKMEAYLAQSFDEDGAGYEGNLYGPYGFNRILPFEASLVRFGYPDTLAGGRMDRMVDQWIAEVVPGGGRMLPINDADGNFQPWPGVHFLYDASVFKNGRAKWMWEGPQKKWGGSGGHTWPFAVLWDDPEVKAEAPTKLVRFAKGRGILTVRTGWEAGDFLAAFECGKRPNGTHCQADHGNFLIYAKGRCLAADTGYSNKRAEGTPNQTVGHNLVLVDGKGMALSGDGTTVEGKIVLFEEHKTFVAAVADLRDAYGKDKANPLVVATRAFVTMTGDDPYVVIVDDFVKDAGSHEWTWLLHGNADSKFDLGKTSAAHLSGDAALDILPFSLDGGAVTFDTVTFPSGSFGDHPLFRAKFTGRRWLAATVLSPRKKSEAPAAATRETKGGALVVKITRGGRQDEVTVTAAADGRLASLRIVRKDAGKVLEQIELKPK